MPTRRLFVCVALLAWPRLAPAQQTLQVSTSKLQFSAPAGGDSPAPQTIQVFSVSGPAVRFGVVVDGGGAGIPAPSWITVRPVLDTTPASLAVTADTGALLPGTYTARIRIGDAKAPLTSAIEVAVTFVVAPGTPQLDAIPNVLRFRGRIQNPGASDHFLILRNKGGGGPLAYTASVANQSPWITNITPANGRIGQNNPAVIRVTINTQGLRVGHFRDKIHIVTPAGSGDVPITVFVAPSGPVLDLDPNGVFFQIRVGQPTPKPAFVKVLNRGDPGTTVRWTAEVLTGSDFVALANTSGTATPDNPGTLVLTGAGARPAPGVRHALIKVSDPQSLGSPQFLAAVVQVIAADSPVAPELTPGGLFFAGATGGTQPKSQSVTLTVSGTTAIDFQVSALAEDGGSWLQAAPSSGQVSNANPATITVSANPAGLAAGVYTGHVRVAIGATLRTVNVTLVAPPAGSANPAERTAGGCTPTKSLLTPVSSSNNFSVPAGWPATVAAQLNDECGTALTSGSVVATFSNGDPPLTLRGDSTATYSAAWQPGTSTSQVSITLRGSSGALQPAVAQVSGSVSDNPSPSPELAEGGVLSNLNAAVGAPLAPGTVAAVYGARLAAAAASPSAVPLPGTFNGTEFLVGGLDAPLYYISPSQLSVQIPPELAPDREYSVIVVVNGALSLPDTIGVAPLQPGVAAYADGTVIAQHPDFSLVDTAHPAKSGEALVMYLIGMGATSVNMKAGAAAPSNPLATAVTQPKVTVDGKTAEMFFAGLTPGGVGLYQINFRVPTGIRTGSVEVVVTQADVAANTVKLPIGQ